MSYVLENTTFADEDILEAAQWYEDQEKGLGSKFLNDLESLLNYLEKNPLLFPQKTSGIHQAPLKIFPYVLAYKIIGPKIILIAVFNCYQHPKKLRNRT